MTSVSGVKSPEIKRNNNEKKSCQTNQQQRMIKKSLCQKRLSLARISQRISRGLEKHNNTRSLSKTKGSATDARGEGGGGAKESFKLLAPVSDNNDSNGAGCRLVSDDCVLSLKEEDRLACLQLLVFVSPN